MSENVLELLESQLEQNKNKFAVVDSSRSLTFEQLILESKKVASALLKYGLKKQPIMVQIDNSTNTLVAFFGVLYSGNYYVPVDPDIVEDKFVKTNELLNCTHIICQNDFNFDISKHLAKIDFAECLNTKNNDASLAEIRKESLADDLLYIMFTSGSTGTPKGVKKTHKSMISYIENFTQTFDLGANQIIANQTPFFFDASSKDIYLMVKKGFTLHLIQKQLFSFPVKLIEYLNENKVTLISWVPSALTIVVRLNTFMQVKPEWLEYVFFVGEVMHPKYLKIWQETLPQTKFINLYGSSEMAGVCCYHIVDRIYDAGETLPIGKPLKNNTVLLLDENGSIVNDGEVGEVCVISDQLALGYISDEQQNKDRFVFDPTRNTTVLRTGDLCYLGKNDNIIFVGRKDFQIKHMGYRIELGEIENATMCIHEVDLACCIYDHNASKIVLYLTLAKPDIAEPVRFVTEQLKAKLPTYMIPNRIIILDELIYNQNNKLDRAKLKLLA